MNQLYNSIGISKQAVNQYSKRQIGFDKRLSILLIEAEELRKEHPGCGVEKMYTTLKPEFIGRDRFVEFFMDLGFRLKKKINYKRTTYSSSVYYPNLIKGLKVNAPSMVWQSDITYIYVEDRFYYAVFIIDVFTKKIVGYQVSNHMRATANVKAIEMALKINKAPMIDHSDRGGQYIYKTYIEILNTNESQISMALSAQDNAYAERINRTIKEEYLDYWKPKNFNQLKRFIDKAVYHYNNKRPHDNIGKLSPIVFENKWLNNQLEFNPNFTIFNNEELIKNGQH
jgi:hypothetical protein